LRRSVRRVLAYAIIAGLFAATLLTLLFPPALNLACFRIKEPAKERQVGSKNRRLLRHFDQ
jgi:hypothetical protein